MIEIGYQLTEEDYVEAHFAHMRQRYGILGEISPRVLAALMILGVVAIVAGIIAGKKDSPLSWFLISVGAFELFPLGILSYLWSGIPFRRQFRKTKSLQDFLHIKIDEEGISFSSINGHGKTLWAYFINWKESPQFFLLYFQKAMFFIMPKRALANEDIAVLRGILVDKIRQPS